MELGNNSDYKGPLEIILSNLQWWDQIRLLKGFLQLGVENIQGLQNFCWLAAPFSHCPPSEKKNFLLQNPNLSCFKSRLLSPPLWRTWFHHLSNVLVGLRCRCWANLDVSFQCQVLHPTDCGGLPPILLQFINTLSMDPRTRGYNSRSAAERDNSCQDGTAVLQVKTCHSKT